MLDSAKWYFVAASWREGGTPVLYVRELASGSTALTGTTTTAAGNVLASIPTGIEPNVNPLVIWIWIGGAIAVAGALIAVWPAPEARRRRVADVYAARLARDLGRAEI